ncbi:MAG: J domain-containing protein [Pseudomonadota bacterium]
MDNRRNSYRLLRVQPEAPTGLIKQSYRTLMQHMRLHPDLGGDTEQAALINLAYRTLVDPRKRAREDTDLIERGLPPKVIGVGPLQTYPKHAATARRDQVNRRHYARVLSLQPDAEQPLVESAKKWIMRTSWGASNRDLVTRAHATLSDRSTRERYMALLAQHSHHGALHALAAETLAHVSGLESASPEPESRDRCPFCNAETVPLSQHHAARCQRCDSPLTPPPPLTGLSQGRRSATRVRRNQNAVISLGWPIERLRVTVTDLSPLGVAFCSTHPIRYVPVVRIETADLVAVVELTHGCSTHLGHAYGGHYLTAHFDAESGTFLRESA